jgi:hypothetical protein
MNYAVMLAEVPVSRRSPASHFGRISTVLG